MYFAIAVQPSWLGPPACGLMQPCSGLCPCGEVMVNSSGSWGEGKCPSPGSRVIQAHIFSGTWILWGWMSYGYHLGWWIQGDFATLPRSHGDGSKVILQMCDPYRRNVTVLHVSPCHLASLFRLSDLPADRRGLNARAMLQTSKYKSQIPTPPTGSVWSFQTVQTLILACGFKFFSGWKFPRNVDPKVVLSVLLILIIASAILHVSICVDQQIPSYDSPNPSYGSSSVMVSFSFFWTDSKLRCVLVCFGRIGLAFAIPLDYFNAELYLRKALNFNSEDGARPRFTTEVLNSCETLAETNKRFKDSKRS